MLALGMGIYVCCVKAKHLELGHAPWLGLHGRGMLVLTR